VGRWLHVRARHVGCAAGSPDSVAVTVTFFSVAVLVTLGLHWLTGGLL
jgi:hypothetical protein